MPKTAEAAPARQPSAGLPQALPGCDLRAVALDFASPAGVAINEFFAYALYQIQLAARARKQSRSRNILEAALSPTLVLVATLASEDICQACFGAIALPRWPAAYIASTRIDRLTIAAWHRFAYQLPHDDWSHVWVNARPGRKETIITSLR